MNPTIELLKVKTELALSDNRIKAQEAIVLIHREFPAIDPGHTIPDIFRFVKRLAEHTSQLARMNNMGEVKHCFNIAEKMLKEGNGVVRIAIQNVYVFSLSVLLDISPVRAKIKGMMNEGLRREYYRQISASSL